MSLSIKYTNSTQGLLERLGQFERAYGMTSAVFMERWVKGELDSHDYAAWAGLCLLAVDAGLLSAPDVKAIAPKSLTLLD